MSIRRIYSTPVILQVTPTAVSVGAESQIFHFWTSKHCVKSVQIRSFSGPYFPPLGLDMERYGVSLRIQSECGKIRTRKNSVFRHFSRGAKLALSKSTSLLLHIRKNIFHENANTFETGPVMISMKKSGFFLGGRSKQNIFKIRKLARKWPYLYILDKREEKQMGSDWNCLLGKFQPSQLVCTPCGKRCKMRCSRKTVCANDIEQVYRVV